MKKLLILICSLTMVMGTFAACFSADDSSGESQSTESSAQATYTVTFVQEGYEDVVVTVKEGVGFVAPTPKDKTGYTVEWEDFDVSSLTEDITVNAIATPNDYTVKYDAAGGAVEKETDTVTYDATPTLATPTREGYEFAGWTYNGKLVLGKWTIAQDVTLVAEWTDVREKLEVTFVQVDGSTKTVEVRKGDGIAEEDIPELIGKTGYEVAWDTADFSNIQTSMFVTAVPTAKTYTVTYSADGYEIDGTTVELEYDAQCTALDMTLEKDGWTFVGWQYNDDTYTQASKWDVADNVTLTARWTENCTVTFVQTNGKTEVKEVSRGSALTDVPTPMDKVGYTVDQDWYTDSSCETVATFENITENMTVYAKATPNEYVVTYDANGGTVATETQNVTYDADYSLVTPDGSAAYMMFEYWYWTKEGETSVMPSSGKWTIADNVTLTAKWTDTREKFTVTFVQDGQTPIVYENVMEGTEFTDIPTPAAKTGYNVTWNETALEALKNVTANVTITAEETAKTYVITLNANGGSTSVTTLTVTYGQAYELPTATWEEYTFKGWKYGSRILAMKGVWDIDAEEITLKAQWNAQDWTDNY